MIEGLIEELKKKGYNIKIQRERGRYTLSLSYNNTSPIKIELNRKSDILSLLYFVLEIEDERKRKT